jgi:hypothetical protein
MYPVADMARSTTAERGRAGIHITASGLVADLAIAQRQRLYIQRGDLPGFMGMGDGQAQHEYKECRQSLHRAHRRFQFGRSVDLAE